ncbi:MAG: hypothetical protein WAL10_20940, partial [Acetobacteraceae bacterium]
MIDHGARGMQEIDRHARERGYDPSAMNLGPAIPSTQDLACATHLAPSLLGPTEKKIFYQVVHKVFMF